jgi:hypothetical protein
MFYKALGFAVWKGAKWYVGRKLPSGKLPSGKLPSRKLPSRKLMLGGALAIGVATVVAAGAKRNGD